MNKNYAVSRPLQTRPFDPLLTAIDATAEQKTAILRDYYDRKITYSLPKKTLTLTFGDDVDVVDLARLTEPEHYLALAVKLTYHKELNRRDQREILKRVAEIKKLNLFFLFRDEANLKFKRVNKKPQALKPAA